MREIKFRGKREDGGKWVYGYIFRTRKSLPSKEETSWIFNEDGKHKVIPETVGQYIERKDKNGKEIFEDDKIRCDRYDSHDLYVVVIKNIKYLPQAMRGSELNSIEVTGNIHEPSEENGKGSP